MASILYDKSLNFSSFLFLLTSMLPALKIRFNNLNQAKVFYSEHLGQISCVPEQLCWPHPVIALQEHSQHPRRYPAENWLSSRYLASVIVQEVVFPSRHQFKFSYILHKFKAHMNTNLVLFLFYLHATNITWTKIIQRNNNCLIQLY